MDNCHKIEEYQIVLGNILNISRRSRNYRSALEMVHQAVLYPNPGVESDFRLVLRHTGFNGDCNINYAIEGKTFGKKKDSYTLKELAEIILSHENEISPEIIARNFIKSIEYPLGNHLARQELTGLETFLLKNVDR